MACQWSGFGHKVGPLQWDLVVGFNVGVCQKWVCLKIGKKKNRPKPVVQLCSGFLSDNVNYTDVPRQIYVLNTRTKPFTRMAQSDRLFLLAVAIC